MKEYLIKLKLNSPLITPLDADSIFGHICWAFRFIKGKKFLENFLDEFEKSPIFLISDGFIDGTVPKPIVPELDEEELKDTILNFVKNGKKGLDKKDFIKDLSIIKKIRKSKIISLKLFLKLNNNFNETNYLKEFFKNGEEDFGYNNLERTIEVYHNTIDRITNSVSEKGNLYTQSETFYKKDTVFNIYIKVFNENYLDLLSDAFEFICKSGFGKDKSTGRGVFDIEKHISRYDKFEKLKGNYIVSFSPFILKSKVSEMFYDLKTKFGKLYMPIDSEANFNPYKKPLLMFTAGSVIKLDGSLEGDIILGSLVKNIHKDKRVRHYAYCYPVKINIS